MLKVKLGRPAIPHILGCVALLGQRVNLSVVKVVISFLATIWRLQKKGGIRYLVIYLKACSSILQQAIGGQRLHDLSPFGARVGRTHAGIPTIIPALHRARIRRGEVWAIRFWMTLFGLYRILEFPGLVKLSTITAETKCDPSLIPKFSHFVIHHLVPSLKRRFRVRGTILEGVSPETGGGPLEFMGSLRASPFLISKSGPSLTKATVIPDPSGRSSPSFPTFQSTSPLSVLASAFMWTHSPLYPVLMNWCKMTGNTEVLNKIEAWSKDLHCDVESVTNWSGKLGFKNEPAGKVRVFAMVDPWTQWLLDRLHKSIFKLLATIPQDGTFDQLKPIHLLNEWKENNRQSNGRLPATYSFDLSAATDRIPIVLQKVLLSPFLTAWGAELWASLLVGRPYHVAKKRQVSKSPGTRKGIWQNLEASGKVYYATGQPMGALSSWAMLAFVHHAFVQWAALSCGKIQLGKGWYEGYAVLGDDVVIAGRDVADKYLVLMSQMDVSIGSHKSLHSPLGKALEFAKRTFLGKEDVSMVPFAEFVMGRQSLAGLLELVRKYSLTFGQTLSVLGYGYKAKANSSKRLIMLPKRLRNYILAFSGPGGPLYDGLRSWLGRKSLTSIYKTVDERASALASSFLETERKLMLEVLATYQGLVDLAKKLGTVHRDREYYGTIKRPQSSDSTKKGPVYTRPRITNWIGAHVRILSTMDQITLIEVEEQYRMRADPSLDHPSLTLALIQQAKERGEALFFFPGDPIPHSSVDVGPLESEPLNPWDSRVEWPWADAMELYGLSRENVLSLTALGVVPETVEIPDDKEVEGATSEIRLAIGHPGVDAPQHVLDELNEYLYRGAFLDVTIEHRDLRTKLEELSASSLDWEGIEGLWAEVREIERKLGEIPFPKNIYTRPAEGKPSREIGKVLKRWYRHSGTFRATVTRVGNAEVESSTP